MVNVLLDTDPGVDDALALLYLHRHAAARLVGITTVAGNGRIESVTRNARYLARRFGIDAPIARGAAAPLTGELHLPPPAIHGHNALGDVPVSDNDHPLDARPAHRFISDTVRARPGEVTLVAVGMLTNLARALLDDPGIAPLVRNVVVMGGAFNERSGNASPVAEANVFGDPAAADIVFTARWPVQIVGLDVTERILMSRAYLATLRAEGTPEAQFIWDVTRGYEAYHAERHATGGIFAHDPAAAVCAIDDTPFRFRSGPVRVIRDGFAAGLTLQKATPRTFSPNAWDDVPEQRVAIAVDAERVLELFAKPFRTNVPSAVDRSGIVEG